MPGPPPLIVTTPMILTSGQALHVLGTGKNDAMLELIVLTMRGMIRPPLTLGLIVLTMPGVILRPPLTLGMAFWLRLGLRSVPVVTILVLGVHRVVRVVVQAPLLAPLGRVRKCLMRSGPRGLLGAPLPRITRGTLVTP